MDLEFACQVRVVPGDEVVNAAAWGNSCLSFQTKFFSRLDNLIGAEHIVLEIHTGAEMEMSYCITHGGG